MAVVSFGEWKKRKQKEAAFNSQGALREDIALKEEYGFDICVFISEEKNAADINSARLEQLWKELGELMDSLPKEHAYYYFKAFEAFSKSKEQEFYSNFDKYLESEKELYGEVAQSDWWIDSFLWVFTPPFAFMYGGVAELFFKHWPLCAMGFVCEALEQMETGVKIELQLDLLTLALQADPECYIAYYLLGSTYNSMGRYKNALHYFSKSTPSQMYSHDPSFYFDYAWAASMAGRYELSTQLYISCIAIDERYPSAINNLGCAYLHMKKYDDAITQFKKAISFGLDGSMPYRNIVALHKQKGDNEKCISFIENNLARLGKRYERELERLKADPDERTIDIYSLLKEDNEEMPGALDKSVIEDQIETIIESGEEVFGKKLTIYQDDDGYGSQYHISGVGRIDFLCTDDTNKLYVIAVSVSSNAEKALIRLWAQMSAVRNKLTKFLSIEGILCCSNCTEGTKLLLNTVHHEKVEVYEYEFLMNKVKL